MPDEYKYIRLSQGERDGMLLETLMAQERDYFVHTLNAERYELILADTTLDQEGAFAKRIQQLLTETLARKAEVKIILNAVLMQLREISVG